MFCLGNYQHTRSLVQFCPEDNLEVLREFGMEAKFAYERYMAEKGETNSPKSPEEESLVVDEDEEEVDYDY